VHRDRVGILACAGASFALASSSFLACSSETHPRAGIEMPSDAGAGVPEAAPPDDAMGPPPSGYDGGVGVGLVDVADTPCTPRGGSVAVVMRAGDAAARPSFRSLSQVGTKRVADAVDGSGFLVFDGDGSNGAFVATSLRGGGSTVLDGQIVFGGGIGTQSASIQAYGTNGAPTGAEVPLVFEEPAGLALGSDAHAGLAVWATRTNVRARGFAGGAPAGTDAYELAVGARTRTPSIAVSSVKDGLFAVAFSGDDGSAYQTAFGRGSATARIGDPSNLFTGPVARSVVGLARTPSGFALLVTVADGANPYAMLLLTDAGGRRTSAGLKLMGTLEATAIAVKGSEIGVLAQRREGDAFEAKIGAEFRAFDLAGAPLGPWVCLEPPVSASGHGGGLVAESNGYAALFGASDGSTSLARFDHLGTGMP
jgi:hypothetical protein